MLALILETLVVTALLVCVCLAAAVGVAAWYAPSELPRNRRVTPPAKRQVELPRNERSK